jgi:hypothetical protein
LRFQQVNRVKLPYGPDGHVDPGQATIRLMNQLADAAGGSTGGAGAGGQPGLGGQSMIPNLSDLGDVPGHPLADYLSLYASGVGTVLDLVALGVELGVGELISPLIGIITTLISLPLAWGAADALARFNGRCQGFWDAMQDMADTYADDSLDKKPLSDWPPVPMPHPHFGSRQDSDLQASELEWRNGQREGALRAYNYVTSMDSSPREFTATNGSKIKLSGRQWLRAVKQARRGSDQISTMIHAEVDKQLKAKGQVAWPVWK